MTDGPMDARLDGSHATVTNLRNVLVAEVVISTQNENFTFLDGQSHECGIENCQSAVLIRCRRARFGCGSSM